MGESSLNSESIKNRWGAADELQIRLLMRLSPARRLQTLMEMQSVFLDATHARLRRAHPELSDLELVHVRAVETKWLIAKV